MKNKTVALIILATGFLFMPLAYFNIFCGINSIVPIIIFIGAISYFGLNHEKIPKRTIIIFTLLFFLQAIIGTILLSMANCGHVLPQTCKFEDNIYCERFLINSNGTIAFEFDEEEYGMTINSLHWKIEQDTWIECSKFSKKEKTYVTDIYCYDEELIKELEANERIRIYLQVRYTNTSTQETSVKEGNIYAIIR